MTVAAALVTGFLFALVNAAHCAGMCGAFALRTTASPPAFARFSLYGAGKLFTYMFLGSLAGFLGASVLKFGGRAQVVLGVAVGAWLALAGIRLLRNRAGATAGGAALGQFLQPILGGIREGELPGGTFALGALTSLLPCGVVYAAALQAAATGNVLSAVALMFGFGAGTLPALAGVAWVGRGFSRRIPAAAFRLFAGSIILLMAAVTITRAVMPLFTKTGSCCH